MYAYITGKAAFRTRDHIIVENGGIGYKVYADHYTLSNAKTGADIKLYTYLKVSEDGMALYGFAQEAQRDAFEKLISISGVGPKAAMGILSSMTVPELSAAVLTNDERAFTKAPGIGKKTAQRIALELKDKIDLSAEGYAGASEINLPQGDAASDACAALMGLGYTRQEAQNAVAAVMSLGDTAEELISLALKRMGG